MKSKTINAVSVLGFTLLISACGGGGTSDTSAPAAGSPAPPTTTSPPTIADLQSSVPAMTYAYDSAEHAFVSEFNLFRSQVGLGLLSQNILLDKAASNHLKYVITNDKLNGGAVDMGMNDPTTKRSMLHIESAAHQFFTGVQEYDRAKFVGYAGTYVGEQVTFGGNKGGRVAFQALAKTVYHRAAAMMQGPRELGVAVGTDLSQTIAFEVGYGKPQRNSADFVGVYPSDNQMGVGLHAGVETPNPFPELSTSNDDFPTKTGYPVSIIVDESAVLEVTTFTITQAGSSSPLSARVITASNDPNRYLRNYTAFLVASEPLKSGTVYNIAFTGRVNSVVMTRNWKFTTQ